MNTRWTHPCSSRSSASLKTNERVILSEALWRVCGEREVEGSPLPGSPLTGRYRTRRLNLRKFSAGRGEASPLYAVANSGRSLTQDSSGLGEAREENLILEILRLHYAPSKTNRALRFAQDDPLFTLRPILRAGAPITRFSRAGATGMPWPFEFTLEPIRMRICLLWTPAA